MHFVDGAQTASDNVPVLMGIASTADLRRPSWNQEHLRGPDLIANKTKPNSARVESSSLSSDTTAEWMANQSSILASPLASIAVAIDCHKPAAPDIIRRLPHGPKGESWRQERRQVETRRGER